VCGYDSSTSNDKLTDLAKLYGIPAKRFKGPELLFALHTYYALLMKLLAAEIISFARGDTSPIQRMYKAATTAKFRREVQELEDGGIFRYLKITNFLEGDLFSWYATDWSEKVESLIRSMLQALDEYNNATLSEDPAETRDLLKNLYHELFPRTVRHALGEYYTPDWLAEHVLSDIRYDGDPDRRLLDPSCGSGTFLVLAIGRIRKYYENNRDQLATTEKELGAKILTNVVGFDLNPIAVMAARTNFLIAIRDLLPQLDRVEIPVYLCDSIVTPAVHGDLFSGAESTAKVPCVAQKPPYLFVPKEIAESSDSVAKYAEALQHSVSVSFSADEFIDYCEDEGIKLNDKQAHGELFNQLLQLQRENRNGIWARIIKNAFAPLFAGKFDFVVGNPPWVSWETLPAEYRKLSADIWKTYRLQEDPGTKRRQSSANSKTDVSVLMTYVAADKYLADGGKLAFVITRTIFQSELGGWNFRRFSLPSGRSMAVRRVHDLDYLKPFRGQAGNITCTFLMDLEGKTDYPVDWQFWRTKSGTIGINDNYDSVLARTERISWQAKPIEPSKPQSAWIFGQKAGIAILKRVIGRSFYATFAREGANTRGANGVYFLDAWVKDKTLFVANRPGDGDDEDLQRYEHGIEDNFVYPLLRGRDVARWSANPKSFILMPHESTRPTEPVPFGHLPKHTREFFAKFREKLSVRKTFRNFDPSGGEFYGLYSVLEATFAQYKVVWREMASGAVAAVVSEAPLPDKSPKIVIPDHKLFIIPCKSADEAHFVAGVFNCSISTYLIKSYALSTGISTHVLERLPIPEFKESEEAHKDIAIEAKHCSYLATKSSDPSQAERKLDMLVAKMFGISNTELEAILDALKEIEGTDLEDKENGE
jgi:methylase of polypeptide subunit release factors